MTADSRPFYPHVSVDCVLIGYDGKELQILLVEKMLEFKGEPIRKLKLPGRLIYEEEDLPEAAASVLQVLTGITKPYLRQFRAFGEPGRMGTESENKWLKDVIKKDIPRIITIAYMSITRLTSRLRNTTSFYGAEWYPVREIPRLPFDHNRIIEEALIEARKMAQSEPLILFNLLPEKFTELEFRLLYEKFHSIRVDVRNFHKKMLSLPYVIALDEKEMNVAHRAARYYRFDKKAYNKLYRNG